LFHFPPNVLGKVQRTEKGKENEEDCLVAKLIFKVISLRLSAQFVGPSSSPVDVVYGEELFAFGSAQGATTHTASVFHLRAADGLLPQVALCGVGQRM
jgi:hypothetical protein